MLSLDLAGQTVQVNQSKIRKNPDPWHDVVIPGVDGRDDYCTVPGGELDAEPAVPLEAPPTPILQPEHPGYSPTSEAENDFISSSRWLSESEKSAPTFWLKGDSWVSETAKQGSPKLGAPWFKQYCTVNDKLSAVVGQYRQTGEPVFLDHTFVSARELLVIDKYKPKVVWINATESNDVAAFCDDVATFQVQSGNNFVVAIPWKSSLWTSLLWNSLLWKSLLWKSL